MLNIEKAASYKNAAHWESIMYSAESSAQKANLPRHCANTERFSPTPSLSRTPLILESHISELRPLHYLTSINCESLALALVGYGHDSLAKRDALG